MPAQIIRIGFWFACWNNLFIELFQIGGDDNENDYEYLLLLVYIYVMASQ